MSVYWRVCVHPILLSTPVGQTSRRFRRPDEFQMDSRSARHCLHTVIFAMCLRTRSHRHTQTHTDTHTHTHAHTHTHTRTEDKEESMAKHTQAKCRLQCISYAEHNKNHCESKLSY